MMDAQTHFFSDCIDLDDGNPYSRTPECDGTGNSNDTAAFHLFHGRVSANDSPMSAAAKLQDLRSTDTRPTVWDGLSEPPGGGPGQDFDQQSLFEDTGPLPRERKGRRDETTIIVEARIDDDASPKSQPSTRRDSSSKSTSRRTSKSASTPTDVTLPDREPPKKKRVRKVKRGVYTFEDEGKRTKFLERNRIAASKCREKKKQYVSRLEEKKASLEHQHALLQMDYNVLLGEVSGLKHQLMAHAKCNDRNIDKWLNNEARRFVQTSNELFGTAFPVYTAAASAPASAPVSASGEGAHSRHPSNASTTYGGIADGLPAASAERRESITTYSHASSLQTSPTETSFSAMTSPYFKTEPDINYDHMPDAMFVQEQAGFSGG